MKDFNFFSPYLLKKKNSRQRKLYTIAVSALITIALLSFTSLNIYQITMYNKEISRVESYLNSKQTIEFLNKYQETTEKLSITKTYYDKVLEAQRFLNSSNTVNTDLLDKLSGALPQNSIMTSLTVSNSIVEIEYQTTNLASIAEIEHNLRKLTIFENVHVGVINNETTYTAIISCSLKDVYAIEAKTDK